MNSKVLSIPALSLLVLLSPALSAAETPLARLIANNACPGCDLHGVSLAGSQHAGANLEGADLRGADLTNTDLKGANLGAAKLDAATLEGTDLRGANLRGASLRRTSLFATRLTGADLRDADLRDLDADHDLEYIDLIGVQLDGARFKHGVRCAGFPAKGGWGCKAIVGE